MDFHASAWCVHSLQRVQGTRRISCLQMEFLRLKVRTTADPNLNRSLGELYKELFGKNPHRRVPATGCRWEILGPSCSCTCVHFLRRPQTRCPYLGQAICYRHGWREPWITSTAGVCGPRQSLGCTSHEHGCCFAASPWGGNVFSP